MASMGKLKIFQRRKETIEFLCICCRSKTRGAARRDILRGKHIDLRSKPRHSTKALALGWFRGCGSNDTLLTKVSSHIDDLMSSRWIASQSLQHPLEIIEATGFIESMWLDNVIRACPSFRRRGNRFTRAGSLFPFLFSLSLSLSLARQHEFDSFTRFISHDGRKHTNPAYSDPHLTRFRSECEFFFE